MMPICGYKGLFRRCQRVAEVSLGEIDSGDVDGYGKPWPHRHYMCKKHYLEVLSKLGYSFAPSETE